MGVKYPFDSLNGIRGASAISACQRDVGKTGNDRPPEEKVGLHRIQAAIGVDAR